MPCEWLKMSDGTVVHINRGRGGRKRQVCKFCKMPHSEGKLCDFPLEGGKTCDAAMCDRCAHLLGHQETDLGKGVKRINDTIDVCPDHYELFLERAAIIEFCGNVSRDEAEQMAVEQFCELVRGPQV